MKVPLIVLNSTQKIESFPAHVRLYKLFRFYITCGEKMERGVKFGFVLIKEPLSGRR